MTILAFDNGTGSRWWRLQQIANYLNARTEHEMFVASYKDWNGDTLGADIVVHTMSRNPQAIDECHAQGAKVIYEADDSVIGVGEDRPELMQLTPEQAQQTIETIKKCDMVTVTTKPLAEHYSQWHDNVVVLPNYLDFLWWGEPPTVKRYGESLRLGWAGSMSHEADLAFIKPVVKRVLDEFPFVKFVYCGHGGMSSTSAATQVTMGKDLFEGIPTGRREFIRGVPPEFWPHKSKTLGFDIGIAPLVDDAFNSTKSAIKYMEYSANRIPGVYQDSIVYRDTVKHGVTGFLATTEDQWFDAIAKLILNEEIRDSLANRALYDVFTNHNLDDHYQEWVEAYQKLL